ncbi:MAG: hypothetical protein KDG55_22500 [Rhodocyclaceae bacterium]|nr:hypothetical protein [Rhodocyclaceae bacterium]
MSAWSCPHDLEGVCQKVAGARCDPGMRGCVLEGQVRFANPEANTVRKPQRATRPEPETPPPPRRRLPF